MDILAKQAVTHDVGMIVASIKLKDESLWPYYIVTKFLALLDS